MLNPDDIHQQAEAERRKAGKRQRKSSRGARGKRFFPKAAESRSVFHQIYPHGPNFFIVFLLPMMLFITGLVLWYIDKRRFHILFPWIWALPAISLFTWLYYTLKELIEYRHYKTWRSDLGFTLHGWDELGQSPKFPKWKFWDRNTILSVHLKPSADTGTRNLVNDLLYLFTVKANKTFYAADQVQPGAAGDLRNKWQHSGELEVSGSANSSVAGQIYLLIDKQLREVQAKEKCIESVSVKFSKDILEIQAIQISD
ncbi:MAG: hypothetical protein JNM88_17625 [Chitinophagaceae bacterium]|nr:hypothetical protein [Chitinophagaceae bacterium]